ncbi:hypothetical protein [Pedobacter montanisoli]|uniref:GLPGLI family protein n=1 Tax=Pedobacter montanisoli TaxID=2923277 RepID=A0ABS9ZYE2_9SPHI|nr:hypothetical protein [Pedobacter montanisoli]MCJ0743318.1 hypothetical protein [Pedobacter montanisoli]
MKKKIKSLILCVAIIQLIATNSLFAQFYSFNYRSDRFEFATLTIGEDCYKSKDMFHELLKPKNDNNLYAIHNKRKDTAYIAKIKISEYPGSNLFNQDEDRVFYKIDTIVSKSDTLLNGFECKRVNIDYVQAFINEQGQRQPYDTIHHVLYIAPVFKTITPFSFVSSKLTGLVLKFVKYHPVHSREDGVLIRTYEVTEILTSNAIASKINYEIFKLPKNAKFLNSYDDFLNSMGEGMADIVKDF